MPLPPADRIVHDARVGHDDAPHEAAMRLWLRLLHEGAVTGVDDPVVQLPLLARVTVLLVDRLGMAPSDVAAACNTTTATVEAELASGRAWLDPPMSETGRRAAAVSAVGGGAVLAATPAFAGTLAAALGVLATGAIIGAAVAPLPSDPLPDPVVVDAEPALPSDEEPADGWPGPTADDEAPDADGEVGEVGEIGEPPVSDGDDPGGDATDQLDDVTDDVTDTVGDVSDDVTDAVDDVTDAVDDVTDAVDDVTDAVDDTVGDVTDDVTDTVEDVTDPVEDTVDDLTGDPLP